MTITRSTLKKGAVVRTLYTPSQIGRSIAVPAGSVGSIEEKTRGLWVVLFPTPLVESDGGMFFYDEEKGAIGCLYHHKELRLVKGMEPRHSTLVCLFPLTDEQVTERATSSAEELSYWVGIYDVSRWQELVSCWEELGLSIDHQQQAHRRIEASCPLLKVVAGPSPLDAMHEALIQAFAEGYHVQNAKAIFPLKEESVMPFIRRMLTYVMEKECEIKKQLPKLASKQRRLMEEATLLAYEELSYLLMDCSDQVKRGEKTFSNELALLRGWIEALESIIYQLSVHAQDATLARLACYYRAQSVLSNWREAIRSSARSAKNRSNNS